MPPHNLGLLALLPCAAYLVILTHAAHATPGDRVCTACLAEDMRPGLAERRAGQIMRARALQVGQNLDVTGAGPRIGDDQRAI